MVQTEPGPGGEKQQERKREELGAERPGESEDQETERAM